MKPNMMTLGLAPTNKRNFRATFVCKFHLSMAEAKTKDLKQVSKVQPQAIPEQEHQRIIEIGRSNLVSFKYSKKGLRGLTFNAKRPTNKTRGKRAVAASGNASVIQ